MHDRDLFLNTDERCSLNGNREIVRRHLVESLISLRDFFPVSIAAGGFRTLNG